LGNGNFFSSVLFSICKSRFGDFYIFDYFLIVKFPIARRFINTNSILTINRCCFLFNNFYAFVCQFLPFFINENCHKVSSYFITEFFKLRFCFVATTLFDERLSSFYAMAVFSQKQCFDKFSFVNHKIAPASLESWLVTVHWSPGDDFGFLAFFRFFYLRNTQM